MEVYRIVQAGYADALRASGKPNRWNRKRQNVIYAASSRALATLELLVHMGSVPQEYDWRVMVISLPDDPCFLTQIHQNQLPVNWRRMSAYAECQRIGSQWVDTCSTLLLKLPSAIVPMEFNVAINADHPEFDHQVRLVRTEPYFWDERWMP